jgi:hypothetical protein
MTISTVPCHAAMTSVAILLLASIAVPNATDTKFRLGSITKQFTAASILLLQSLAAIVFGETYQVPSQE